MKLEELRIKEEKELTKYYSLTSARSANFSNSFSPF
jgi:hypothetical protein